MKLNCHLTIDDLIHYNEKYIGRYAILYSAMIELSIFFVLFIVLSYINMSFPTFIIIPIIMAASYIPINRIYKHTLRKDFQKELEKTGLGAFDVYAELTDEYLAEISPLDKIKFPVEQITSIKETEDFIVIHIKKHDKMKIPIQWITNMEEKDIFITAVKERIANRP